MRGVKAKRLRREAYGDLSLRNPRQYVKVNAVTLANAPRSPRAVYQRLKAS